MRAPGYVAGVILVLALPALAKAPPKTAPAKEAPAAPTPEMQPLRPYVGDWEYEHEIRPNPYVPVDRCAGTVSAAWVLGGAFLELRYRDACSDGVPVEIREIDGWDANAQRFWARQFVSGGVTRTWAFDRDADGFRGDTDKTLGGRPVRIRITTRFAPDGNRFVETGEVSADGNEWHPFTETRYTRAAGRRR